MDALRVGIIGLGTVGASVAQILQEQSARMSLRSGREIRLVRAAVRDLTRSRGVQLSASALTTDPMVVARAPDVDVVVELMGGLHPAREAVLAALQSGKDVVTANKALLCEHGGELFRAAREAVKKAKADVRAAQQPLDKIEGAEALVGHAKGKWLGGAAKGIAEAEAELKAAADAAAAEKALEPVKEEE